MGTSNLCVDDAHKSVEFERSQQSMSMSLIQNTLNYSSPTRTSSVNQIYQRLIEQKPAKYSLEAIKNQYQPTRMKLYGDQGIYIGDIKEGKPHGPGQIYFTNNNFLEAVFKEGELDCEDAILIESNGNYYRGGFKEYAQTGMGVLRASGSEWRGRFSAGRISGNGQLEYSDGTYYKGQFKNGKMHGKGKLIYKNGDAYQGYFKQGKRWGIGHLQTSLYQYFGPFEEDKKEGKGTVVLKSGDKFEGWFQGDKINGYGELHRKEGQVLKKKYESQQIQKLII